MSINQYFDKIYLLNLQKRSDRLQPSKTRLDSLDIQYEVFFGCDGSVINHLFNKLGNGHFTNPNYLGCAISHLSIYQDAIHHGYDKILILEDDNLIHSDIHNIFDTIEIPEWNDLFYLGYIPLNDDCSMWDYRFGIQGHNMLNDNIFRCTNLWGLFSYGIKRNLMIEMIETYNTSFPMEIDRFFVNTIQPRGGSIAIAPQLFCCDDNIYSDNLGYAPMLSTKSIDSRFANRNNYI